MNQQKNIRNSFMDPGEIYFVTSTIHSWIPLLKDDIYKEVIIDSFRWLCVQKMMDVFAFVIMPNHIHLIIRSYFNQGKEAPYTSFLKYTAHAFKKILLKDFDIRLKSFQVRSSNKNYCFWHRDSLAIQLYSLQVAFQKLDYIHLNPLGEKWNLTNDPSKYFYSSASFYESDSTSFSFLKDLRDEF